MHPPHRIHSVLPRLALFPLGALICTAAAWGQRAPAGTASDELRAATAAQSTAAAAAEKAIELSPFTVSTSKDKGYFAENTLAGSRMNTNLADLGASISVVNRAQLEDTASVDLNDVFRYEVNTEGSGTYTPQTQAFRSDGLLDVNAGGTQGNNVASLTNATANRVRGLGVPGASTNYYPSIAAIPPDAYNIQSFEISRGPNSMLFGIGSPAGIVNQSTSQAMFNRNTNRADVRLDNWGSARSSFSFNRDLVRDKLAVFGAFLFDDRRFQRKPSYDTTRRQYGAISYKPFTATTVRVNFEAYSNSNRRPNTVSPIDYITQWNLAGRPTYDALTKRITKLTTGEIFGPYVSSASSPFAQQVRDFIISRPGFNSALRNAGSTNNDFTTYNGITIFGQTALNPGLSLAVPRPTASALYVPGLSEVNQARSLMQIGNGQLKNWFQPLYTTTYRTAWGIAGNPSATAPAYPTTTADLNAIWANPTWADMFNRDYFQSTGWTNNSFVTNLGGYRYPGVTDRSIYDWKKINTNQANFGYQRNQNYNVEVEQKITDNLFLNAGWFRQDFDQITNYTIAQLNATALRIDVNKYLPDGTANPYFGLPFVIDFDPDRYVNAEIDDHFRAMLAYTPDFTRKSGWQKWLGHHQLLGLWSRDEYMSVAYRQRLNYVAAGTAAAGYRYLPNPNNNADGTRTGWSFGSSTSLQRNFYLANPGDPMGQVTRSSGEWNPITYSGDIRVYDYANSRFDNANVTTFFNNFDSPVRNQKTLQTLSAGMTNYFWKERLVTTFGARLDKFKARATTTGAMTLPDGTAVPALTNPQKISADGYFNTESMWNRFNRWNYLTGRTKTGGGVLRAFRGWDAIDRRASEGNQFWQFVRDFGVSYNWSNNFDVPPSAQVDAFGTPLPKPAGVGRDYGFQFTMLDNKLFARVTWFRSTNANQRVSPGTTINRLTDNIDTTLFRNWARTIAMINMGMDPRTDTFGQNLATATENAVQAAATPIWKQPYNYYTDLPGVIGATQDSVTKGMEIQLNYNTGNWRNRLTFGQQETINSNVLRQFDAWYAVRAPVWQSAKASDYLLPQYQNLATYTTTGGTPVDISTFWRGYGFQSAVRLNDPFGNTNVENYYGINVTPQIALGKDLEGQAAPNQRKYRWSYNTGYDFTTGWLKGFGVGGAERWESKSVIGYYGKSSRGNTANPNLIDVSDTTRPVYDKANAYTDLFVRYKRRIWGERVMMSVQLNVVNAFEDGHLQVTSVNYDGSPYGFRIIDPRQFILSASFEF